MRVDNETKLVAVAFAQEQTLERTLWRKLEPQNNANFMPVATAQLLAAAQKGEIKAYTNESKTVQVSPETLAQIAKGQDCTWEIKEKWIFERSEKKLRYEPSHLSVVSSDGQNSVVFDYADFQTMLATNPAFQWTNPHTNTTMLLAEAMDKRLFFSRIVKSSNAR